MLTDVLIIGDPQCNTKSQSIGGDIIGTNGTVALSQTEGTSYTLETTTSRAFLAISDRLLRLIILTRSSLRGHGCLLRGKVQDWGDLRSGRMRVGHYDGSE